MKSGGWNKLQSALRWLLWLAVPIAAAAFLVPGTLTWTPLDPSETPGDEKIDSQPLSLSGPASRSAVDRASAPPAALDPEAEGVTSLPWPEELDGKAARADGHSSLDCLIQPYQMIDVGSPVAGLIESIYVERSQTVEQGEVLVELDASVERAVVELAQARAQMKGELNAREALLELQKRKKKRADRLFEQDAVSLELREELETEEDVARRELEQAQDGRRLASLELEQARRILDRRTIRSPIAGVVVERLMSPGERVDEDPVLRLAQLDPLRVEVVLPSVMFGKVAVGTRAMVIPELVSEEVYIAEVSIVDPIIDAASGTFGLRLELPNPKLQIPGGLHCQVRFLDE